MTRVEERRDFDIPVRVALAESDLDRNDQGMAHIAAEVKALRNVLVGILVSIATAAVLFAINIAVQAAGG